MSEEGGVPYTLETALEAVNANADVISQLATQLREVRVELDVTQALLAASRELRESEKKRADAFCDALHGQYNVENNLKAALAEASEQVRALRAELERMQDVAFERLNLLTTARAENEALRALLKESRNRLRSAVLLPKDLRDRIAAALGEKP